MHMRFSKSLLALTLSSALGLLAACKAEESTTVDTTTSTDMSASQTDTTMTTASSTDTTAISTDTSMTAGGAMANMSAQDHEFAMKAATGGLAEVQLGQLAQQKAQSADVKSFAQQMVQDHSQANTELTQLVSQKGMTPPADLDEEHKAVMTKLTSLSGAEFDKEYMRAMVADHHKTVELFEKQASGGSDAELKAFATKTVPKLKEHHTLAEGVARKVGAGAE